MSDHVGRAANRWSAATRHASDLESWVMVGHQGDLAVMHDHRVTQQIWHTAGQAGVREPKLGTVLPPIIRLQRAFFRDTTYSLRTDRGAIAVTARPLALHRRLRGTGIRFTRHAHEPYSLCSATEAPGCRLPVDNLRVCVAPPLPRPQRAEPWVTELVCEDKLAHAQWPEPVTYTTYQYFWHCAGAPEEQEAVAHGWPPEVAALYEPGLDRVRAICVSFYKLIWNERQVQHLWLYLHPEHGTAIALGYATDLPLACLRVREPRVFARLTA